jgi:phospholipase/carboxylesterase
MNRLQTQVQSHLSAVRQNTEKLLTKGLSKSIQQPPSNIRKTQLDENALQQETSRRKPSADFRESRVAPQDMRTTHAGLSAGISTGSPLALDFSHRLFTPEHYQDRYEYPLVIWLHSQDSSEYELDGVMPHLSLRNYVAIAPRAIQRSKLSERKFCWTQNGSGAAQAEQLVMQSIAHAINDLSIRPDRVFLAGYGMGGTLAQWIGLRNSESIAGVVSINGVFPKRCESLLQWRESRNLPVLFIHGGQSAMCDADQTCHALQSAHRNGLSYQFLQFPCGDELNTAMTAMANQFIMKIVTE